MQEVKITNEYENIEWEFITERVEEGFKEWLLPNFLKENNIKEISDTTEFNFSLSNSQGDGVSFTGTYLYNKTLIKLYRTSNNYAHANTINTEVQEFNEIDVSELTEEQDETSEKIAEEFLTLVRDFCNYELEKKGYEIQEEEQKDQIQQQIFNKFKIVNNIVLKEGELWNFNFSDEEKDKYTFVGKSDYVKLFVELPKLKKIVEYNPSTKYIEE